MTADDHSMLHKRLPDGQRWLLCTCGWGEPFTTTRERDDLARDHYRHHGIGADA